MEEDLSLKERLDLNAESMLPPLPGNRILWYTAATAAALLLSALPLTPLFLS